MTAFDMNISLSDRIWKLFGSLKFTLFILFSLASLSIIGTVIEQNQPAELYMAQYGTGWTALILRLGLNNMYHTWWFSVLLILLVLNISVCTINRFPPKWRSFRESGDAIDTRAIKNLENNHTIFLQEDLPLVKEKALTILRKRRYTVRELDDREGIFIYAWKGVVGRFGSDITHVSLLLILTGALLGSIFGFKDFGVFYEGETSSIPVTELHIAVDRSWYGIPLPRIEQRRKTSDIQLRLDKFWVDYYETGQIKQYNSLLTVSDGGREVIQGKQIWVNEPLSYKGLTFYQSSYGTAYDRVKSAEFYLKDKKTQKAIAQPFTVEWNKLTAIPGTDYSVRIAAFVSDFAQDPSTGQVVAQSAEHNNPAIGVEISKEGKIVSGQWLFYRYVDFFGDIPGSNYALVFQGYQGIVYSGLSINQDPGTVIVWAGCTLMAVGFFVAFFIFHKKIWIHIKKKGTETEVHVGGTINKNKFIFERELSEIVETLKAAYKGGAHP